MRFFTSADRRPAAPPAKKSSSKWRRQGAAILASLGVLSPVVAPAANANAINRDPTATQSLIRLRADNCQSVTAPNPPVPLKASFDRVSAGFDRLQALPITGAPIIAAIRNPAHRFQVCLDPNLPGMNGILAAYSPAQNRLFLPSREFDFISAVHEAYHGYQDTQGGLDDSRLHPRDVLISHLLTEAAAAAYSIMVMRELAFTSEADAAIYKTYMENRNNTYGQGRTFDMAFEAAYARDAALPEDQRRRNALEAGGQAVVSGLMAGAGEGWRRGYAARAATAANSGDTSANTTSRRYQEERAQIYQRTGRVGNDIQIIPAPFYGPNADANAAASLMILGLEVHDVPAPPAFASSPRLAAPRL